MINYKVPLNRARQNAWIKANVLSREEMEKPGFRLSLEKNHWIFIKTLQHDNICGTDYDTSLNITINCKNNRIRIDVMDELWLQPYNYQTILRIVPDHEYALDIHNKVQAEMKRLIDLGIITGYTLGDYI